MSLLTGYVVGDEALQASFHRLPNDFQGALKTGVGRACLLVQKLTKEALSGYVLNVKTGRLRRSINTRIDEKPMSVQGIVGTNVQYAGVHEFGFQGVVPVREHLRKTVNGGQATVRAHNRSVDMPERSFLRSSLHRLQPEIRREIETAINAQLARVMGGRA